IEGVEKVRMTILAPIAMVALPLVMTKVMTDYPVPDPMSLAFLLPLILAPFTLARFVPLVRFIPLVGRFIPHTVSARTVIKIGFLMVVVGDAIWLTPHGFVPTGAKLVAELELPSDWNFLALMPAKNSAAFTLFVVFFVVVSFAIIVTLRPSDSKGHAPEGDPVPARAK